MVGIITILGIVPLGLAKATKAITNHHHHLLTASRTKEWMDCDDDDDDDGPSL